MPRPRIVLQPTDTETPDGAELALRSRFAAVRAELGLDAPYPADALAEAERVCSVPPLAGEDLTDLPFFTVDPPGSTDLDQALHLERDGDGHRIRYAIADVPAFVPLGAVLDRVTRERGQTVYLPDGRVPLHPPVLSEGAGSLLPNEVRPALVWDLRLDSSGELTSATVARAAVRSVAQFDYETVQRGADSANPDLRFVLLREVGERRIAQERARGGASLPLPEQQVSAQPDGDFTLAFRPPVPAEDWNAQVSLLTGMAAARMMLDAGVGVLRTMPMPTESALARFRRAVRGIGVPWPDGVPYGELIRTLDWRDPRHLGLVHEATMLFRGASYTAVDGAPPEQREHAAVAAPYAHVTAPLRRLVDRFGLAVCEALSRGVDVPDDVRAALPLLPGLMRDSGRRVGAAERACTDAAEAAVLSRRVGEEFAAVVVDHTERGMEVQLAEVPVLALLTGPRAGLGAMVRARLAEVDIAAGAARFVRAP
ncbi:MAG: RNB domain-containing ribonuclease [Dermatophilaceae bacterium]